MIIGIIAAEDYLGDTTPPVITSDATINAVESVPLAHVLTADESATFAITGGADASLFEIDGGVTLRFAGNTTHTVASPADADANNVFEVEVTADDGVGNVSDPQSITLYLTDASGWFVAFDAGSPTGSSSSFGNKNTRQRISSTFRRGSNSKVRVTFAAAAAAQLAIAHAAIGIMEPWFGSTNTYDMQSGTPVALTFDGGSASVIVGAGNTKVSDEATFSFLETDILILPIHHQNATSSYRLYNVGTGNSTPQLVNGHFEKSTASDESLIADASGYGFDTGDIYGITKIEVKQA